MSADADVVVVGAGPVGCALALMLSRAGLRTTILDRARFPRDKPCGEGLLPAGARVLEELGLPLAGFPTLNGVTYRLPDGDSVEGGFAGGSGGFGVRRLVFDALLAERAAATANVELACECGATGLEAADGRVRVVTAKGMLEASYLVGADGLGSHVARWMGWSTTPSRRRRYALVGHLEVPDHPFDRIVVTLLDGCEVYLAPTGRDELLIAVLGSKQGLRPTGERVQDAYARRIREAHPELSVRAPLGIRGAGPFWVRPRSRAAGRVFLVGDAAGFLDPLTGDGISAGLLAARRLSAVLAAATARADEDYARWEARQWRRRVFMSRLALALTGSSAFARLAFRGLKRRPGALDRLLEVNDGSRSPASVPLTDWAALAGI